MYVVLRSGVDCNGDIDINVLDSFESESDAKRCLDLEIYERYLNSVVDDETWLEMTDTQQEGLISKHYPTCDGYHFDPSHYFRCNGDDGIIIKIIYI